MSEDKETDRGPVFLLRVAVAVIGLIFILGVYPLTVVWPSGWAWTAIVPGFGLLADDFPRTTELASCCYFQVVGGDQGAAITQADNSSQHGRIRIV